MKIMLFAAGGDIGGGKTHILSLAKELSADHELMLISFRRGVLADEAQEMGLDVVVMDNGFNTFRDIKASLAEIDRFRPDVIHCHGAKANMMGTIMKKMRHVPVMTTVHSDPKLDYMGMPLKQCTIGLVNSIALRNMDFYIAVAGKMKRNLIERGVDPYKIFTVYNGLDFTGAREEPKPFNEDGNIVVGIAARLTPIKDIGTLLRAFALAYAQNSRLYLKIAGTGEDEQSLRELAKTLKIQDRVEFAGWVSDVKGFFADVDINVLSSLSEGFPYSLLEGAYEHCAVIATRVGGIPYLISHGENGFLFNPGEVELFAEYIYRLSVNEGLRRTLAENLFEKARKECSLQTMKENQEAAYERIMGRKTLGKRQGAVICGAYGKGNAGDEAILKAILGQLREIDPDLSCWVMSRNKKETRAEYEVRAMYTFNIFAFFSSLKKAKIFVNGGGSLIQDVTSTRSLYFYLFTLLAARHFGCKVLMYGCGIGPIRSEGHRRTAGRILNDNVDMITLRDSQSMELLRELKVEKPSIQLAADPVINIKESNFAMVEEAFRRENIPGKVRKIGFCLRDWPGFDGSAVIAEAADYAYEKYKVLPVFVPVEVPLDVNAARKVTERMKAPYYLCSQSHSVEDLIGMLGSMEVVVGIRLHSLIFATAGGAPVIGISYDIKVDSFMRDIGNKACISLQGLTAERLCREIDEAMGTRGHLDAAASAETLKRRERINSQAATRLLKEGGVSL